MGIKRIVNKAGKFCFDKPVSAISGLPFASLTFRLLILVVIAVLPAILIQAYNEYDLRKAREDDIRQRVI